MSGDGCDRLNDPSQRLLVHDRVETVVRIGSVLHDASGAIWLNQRVGPLDYVARSCLLLALGVTCKEFSREY